MTDDEIIAGLKSIDEDDDVEVTDWEADFLDSVKKMPKPRRLSEKQRAVAIRMIEKYGRDDEARLAELAKKLGKTVS